jgi:hypothetical protein
LRQNPPAQEKPIAEVSRGIRTHPALDRGKIPWRCHRLVVGTGNHSALPVMKNVKLEAERRKVELVILPTADAIKLLNKRAKDTNAILHVTC